MDLVQRKFAKSFPQLNLPIRHKKILQFDVESAYSRNLRIPQRRKTRSKSAIT